MSFELSLFDESYEAASDFSSAQYSIVALTTDDPSKITLATSPTATGLVGVVQNDVTTEKAATVRHLGISKVLSDGSGTTIAPGDLITTSTDGKGIKAVTANHVCIGRALKPSSADGTIISVLMTGLQRFSST